MSKKTNEASVNEYKSALRHLLDKKKIDNKLYFNILTFHYSAANQAITMAELAAHLGYGDYSPANFRYGFIGRVFASHLDRYMPADKRGNCRYFSLVARTEVEDSQEKKTGKEFVFYLHKNLSTALEELGLVQQKLTV
ncbi:hypothetical protein [Vibrio crassostreae]|uniref:hypothetical protein n=1 Tax=Vibrio crassostreae TaxID=246167 RepID=UPI000632C854|nr:hypothetical protein [Vibrio crassostreae]CAH6804023.1 conserved hypothetical protein [Vibrio chagasii]CAH6815651.1 conserved hypothetical protein [Vibrio chagasii]CAH6818871.1 conserved hypothetical protein [Vibrio chagasii]CAH6826061.1 conserved hypothetical protein [Vibrio chagasii]CAH6862778.1 conserved hypothetical protein [Vibrio chagasii]